jgi:DNA-binding transcriptional MerR regulator
MASSRVARKSAAAFRTISEVSEELDVPQHVLRFWETKFAQVRPLKRGGGRRYYRPEDVELLRRIRGLLYNDGYTIKGVQKLLREHSGKAPLPSDETGPSGDGGHAAPPLTETSPEGAREKELRKVLSELVYLRDLLARRL